MGSTREIAEAIGRELETSGIQVTVARCAENVNPDVVQGRAQWVAEPDQLANMWPAGGVVLSASGVRNVFIRVTGRVVAARPR
jgi:hypothetical protein